MKVKQFRHRPDVVGEAGGHSRRAKTAPGDAAEGALKMRLVQRFLKQLVFYVVVLALVIFAVWPFYWMLVTAFKTEHDLYNLQAIPYIFNEPPTLKHVRWLFNNTEFVRWLWNSLFIGVLVAAITLLVAVPAGYALARMAGRYAESLGIGIFLTYPVPPTLLFIPLSPIISRLGLQDSLWALVMVYPTFTIPFCTWLMMGFVQNYPARNRRSRADRWR